MKSLPLINVSNHVQYLERSDSNSFSITSSDFDDSWFPCYHFFNALRSSSMSSEDVKLIAIVNLIFHVSDFLRLFRMSFKYGLILSRYSFIGKVIFLFPLLSYSIIAIKVTYSYWFLIISFLLKKCLHLSNYSAIDCFIFIFLV